MVCFMEILQLKYFSHAAKTESFSQTARHFMVPTSCVSSSIKKLENEIGVKFFDRTANKIKLNEYGKIFLQAIEKSEKLINQAKTDIFDLSQTPFGEINLLVLTNRQKVTEAVSDFKRKYPKTSLNIRHQFQENLSTLHAYDVIITDQIISDTYFDKHFWLTEEICLAVHKDNRLSDKLFVSTNELQKEKFISLDKHSRLRHYMDVFFEENLLSPNLVIECDDPQYVRKYLSMGLGVTFFPKISWADHISNDFCLLRINEGLYRTSYIYINKSTTRLAQIFAQMLISTT